MTAGLGDTKNKNKAAGCVTRQTAGIFRKSVRSDSVFVAESRYLR